ncbi:hypothetical protein CDL15_Pgr018079 [Punica granatum]|uniref:BHLH domain-containing protein n=1 Tax=Punica granatum TaxID=22663 RepID=A0A218WHA1_PUNGR|nr:hypothetical protein CDL15_Pgr018079 [Punica granatum]
MEDAFYEEDQMGQVMGNMLLQVHLLGEGAIGQAAITGKHRWMFAGARESQEVKLESSVCLLIDELCFVALMIRKLFPVQADSEVLQQLSAGVETLLVIPIEHHGVVQFGATKKIMESAEFVDETKKLFHEMDNADGIFRAGNVPSSSNSEASDINSLFASLLSHGTSCNMNLRPINSGIGLEKLIRSSCSTTNPVQSLTVENEEDLSHLFASIPTVPRAKSSFTEGSCISSWSSDGSVSTSLEPPMSSSILAPDSSNAYCVKLNAGAGNFGINHLQPFGDAEVQLPKASTNLKRSFDEFNLTDPTADVSSSCLIDDLSQWFAGSPEHGIAGTGGCFDNSIEQSILVNSGNYNASNVHSMERELFNSFGVDLGCVLDGNCWDVLNSSNQAPCNTMSGFPSTSEPRKGLFSELGIEELLEGIGSTITKSSFKDPLSASRRKGAEGLLLNGPSNLAHKSQVGLWIDDSYSINAGGAPTCAPKRAEEPAKPSRKRARPGESTRPRPKDRQQIQDRLKELRGIIPNGAKCSIDALLDRTIKHMLFLQNVTKYADKLKRSDEPKLVAHENGVVLKDESRRGGEAGSSGGTTWAFEVGSQSMVCPIIVEDLSPPGQMLIEMLCEERGLFLEIADIVRGFGLNILKGVMEVRDNKIWSHFIVEATRHVTRMDVFWSLVQLLQQTAPRGPDFANPPKNHLMDGAVLPCNSYKQTVASPYQLAKAR